MSAGIASFSEASAFAALSKSPNLEQLNPASVGHESRRRGGRHGLGLRDQQRMIAVREVPRRSSSGPGLVVDHPDPRNAPSVASPSMRAIRAATESDTESSMRTSAALATVRIAPRRPRRLVGPGVRPRARTLKGPTTFGGDRIACPGVASGGGFPATPGQAGAFRALRPGSPTGGSSGSIRDSCSCTLMSSLRVVISFLTAGG